MKNTKIFLFIFLLIFSFGVFSKVQAVDDSAMVNISCASITDTSYIKFAGESQVYNNLPAGNKNIVIGCLDKYSTPVSTTNTTITCSLGVSPLSATDPYPGAVKACFYKLLGVPTVISPTATSITQTTATLGATVSSLGTPAVLTARGVQYRTETGSYSSSNPATLSQAINTPYTVAITGLTCNKKYYYKGYATNTSGTGYSPEASFTTSPCPGVPALINPTATNITANSATLGATVSSLGTPAILTARGVQYGTVSGNYTSTIPATLAQTVNVPYTVSAPSAPSILAECTTYYYRGYATNGSGTGYSPELSFKTLCTTPVTVPTVSTNACSSITQTGMTSGGNVTLDGGASLSARGIVWNTTGNPTIASSKKVDASTTLGSFGTSITGLTANTIYYIKAYATNSAGTGYGNEVACKTLGSGFYSIKFDKNGGTGVMYDQVFQENEKIFLSKNTFTKSGSYFVGWNTRANGSATSFLDQQEITTNVNLYLYAQWSSSAPTLPTVQTLDPSFLKSTSANAQGIIMNNGGADSDYGGFVYGLISKGKPTSTTPPDKAGYTNTIIKYGYYKIGRIIEPLQSLTPNTTYYIRFYAHNIAGIAYGNEISFTTPSSGGTTLTVTKAGTGTGTVTSNPAGISCGSDCTEAYTSGTSVTLTASPDSGVNFTGWSGEGCSGTGTCIVVVDKERYVTATFDTITVSYPWLRVFHSPFGNGNGRGSIVGEATNPTQSNNFNCGPDCPSQSESYVNFTTLRLVAIPEPGSKFIRWVNGYCGTWSPTNPICIFNLSPNYPDMYAWFEIDNSNPVTPPSDAVPWIDADPKVDLKYNGRTTVKWKLVEGSDPDTDTCLLTGGGFNNMVNVNLTESSDKSDPLKKDTEFKIKCGNNEATVTVTVKKPYLGWDEN